MMPKGNFAKNVEEIVKDFDAIPRRDIKKPRVGVVGEILVKYHPNANNDIVGIIEEEGGEAVVLDLIDFFMYGFYSERFNYKHLSGTYKSMKLNEVHELLFQNGINLNDIETYKKRGIGIYRKHKEVVGFNKKENRNQTSYRSYVHTDWELPKFTEEFFKKIGVIK